MRTNTDHAPRLLHLGLKKLFTTRASVRMQPFSAPRLVLLCGFTPTPNRDGPMPLRYACNLHLDQFAGKGISLGVSPPLTYFRHTNAGMRIFIRSRNATDPGWR